MCLWTVLVRGGVSGGVVCLKYCVQTDTCMDLSLPFYLYTVSVHMLCVHVYMC